MSEIAPAGEQYSQQSAPPLLIMSRNLISSFFLDPASGSRSFSNCHARTERASPDIQRATGNTRSGAYSVTRSAGGERLSVPRILGVGRWPLVILAAAGLVSAGIGPATAGKAVSHDDVGPARLTSRIAWVR